MPLDTLPDYRDREQIFWEVHLPVYLPNTRISSVLPRLGDGDHISSISFLPQELLYDIFLSIVEDVSSEYLSDLKAKTISHVRLTRLPSKFNTAALALAQVSCRWREIAISMTRLWSSIFLQRADEGSMRLVQLYLSRSGNQPLDLVMNYVDIYRRDDLYRTYQILGQCADNSHRWKSIDFQLIGTRASLPDLQLAPRHIDQALTNLQAVYFYYDSDESTSLLHALTDGLWTSPKLREVGLGNLEQIPQSVSLQNLVKLHISTTSVQTLVEYLPECSHLRSLVVERLTGTLAQNQMALQPTLLPHLRTLILGIQNSFVAVDCLTSIMTPKLQTLSFTLVDDRAIMFQHFAQAFRHFLFRSGISTLRSLLLSAPSADVDVLASCLSSPQLATVRECELHLGRGMTDEVLSCLIDETGPAYTVTNTGDIVIVRPSTDSLEDDTTDATRPCLPSLTHLRLDECHTTDGFIGRIATSRLCKAPRGLESAKPYSRSKALGLKEFMVSVGSVRDHPLDQRVLLALAGEQMNASIESSRYDLLID
ncbi:hypothetical protein BDN72DRAFT_288961 [Pluteus cervinus]|uniref:Uncharacterized protein n=1 Tax=Pluteus cervinus TaxID=181527 RepID=A0ACD3AFD8_9AGAR|nr:hypothetical protein BDN72DRAFT_288961 [Pluteus cervinus]